MNRPIILIANSCPFGGETFLRNELDYIPTDRSVYLCPILTSETQSPSDWGKPHIRVITDGAHPSAAEKLAALCHSLTAPFRHGELRQILRHPNPVRNFLKAVKFAYLGDSRARALARRLRSELPGAAPVIYAYWFYESAYAAARLQAYFPGSRAISRCHGYDLYEIRHPGGYLPFRPYLSGRMDTLCPISQDGAAYAKARFPHCPLRVSRLGTADHGLCRGEKPEVFTLVSCSNLLEVKRVDLLIRGLSLCRRPIRWLHFGDGPLRESLIQQARKLPDHIQWKFMGSVPNAELMDFYRDHYADAFINVSSSEGVPVSIMEAMSFGIPAIATDVGGTHEIVIHEQNGLLLPADTEPEAIAAAICRLAEADCEAYRRNARAIWQERCDAAAHYRSFYEMLDQ